ncbi:phosphatidate cytidylyltransferase [Alysiella filiformis]|uniref:Phosphatidate cytidylyltransferase n=1 Tax=Alysiella filiformis DSM 16848 TaxID=1120981 RepID=A0A286EDZ7_9NEIS|nr:phosphatidate cytidylyltransferase [Alysiella filiformis]QMT31687.1 phosphatidate cytidylyltransferase [Alysiella filiformis]UBQ55304.1 phosphatidate cytidylyltransferase [Alysiella filiformis DSM 16848]SOD69064.1 phosphatidate cytidylyltransferase [Alysiella filiformis DSM 16848]
MNNALPIQAGFVFAGVFAVLLLATLIGNHLKNKHILNPNPVINNMNARISSWWVMMMVLLFAFWFDHIGATLLFFFISLAALREFMTLIYQRRGDHNAIAACFYVLLPLQYYFVLTNWYGMFAVLIPVYAFLILPIISGLSGDTVALFERSAKIQWGAMMSIFCLSHVPAIMTLNIPEFAGRNILLLIFMIVVVQSSDVLQYIFGKLWGKTPIAPALSPNKTVVGTVGGMASATILAACLYQITPFTPFQAALIGFVMCVMGFLGGLVMSGIKRSYGVKDWGKMIHGHGGMLDRVDSICFAAPVFFHIVRYFWA